MYEKAGVERCGVITSQGLVIELKNSHPTPSDNFAMDLAEFPENTVATWHTHPASGPNLSVEDYGAFKGLPHLLHLIISGSDIWGYYMENDILLTDDNNYLTRLSARVTSLPD